MNVLTGFTDSPKQKTTVVLDNGTNATLELEYRPQQLGWFYNLEYQNFLIQGQRLVYSPNLLRQFQGQIPFGLAVVSTDKNDPLQQTDFSSGKAVLILLNEADAAEIETAKFTRND